MNANQSYTFNNVTNQLIVLRLDDGAISIMFYAFKGIIGRQYYKGDQYLDVDFLSDLTKLTITPSQKLYILKVVGIL